MGKEEVVAVLFHESCYCLGENGGGDAPFFYHNHIVYTVLMESFYTGFMKLTPSIYYSYIHLKASKVINSYKPEKCKYARFRCSRNTQAFRHTLSFVITVAVFSVY